MRLFTSDPQQLELGLLCIRVAVGCIFVVHGWSKLTGGIATWNWLGSQLAPIGITFLPTLWGFLAMLAEFCGGICLVLGLGTRIAAALISCVMLGALTYHINKGDSFNDVWSHAFSLLFVFIGLCIAGSGRYSLDYYFNL